MLQVDVLTNFAQQALQDSQKAISALNAEQIQIRKVVLQKIGLRYSNGCTRRNLCHYSYPMLSDRSTNVSNFAKYMNKMIEAMDTPEASITSL